MVVKQNAPTVALFLNYFNILETPRLAASISPSQAKAIYSSNPEQEDANEIKPKNGPIQRAFHTQASAIPSSSLTIARALSASSMVINPRRINRCSVRPLRTTEIFRTAKPFF
jgi:hypothetical protein